MKPYALFFVDDHSGQVQWWGEFESPDAAMKDFADSVGFEIGHGREDEMSQERLCWCVLECRELADGDLARLEAIGDSGDAATWAIVEVGRDVTPDDYCYDPEML